MEILPRVHRITVGKSNIQGLHPPNVYLVMGRRLTFVDTGYNRTDDINVRLAYLKGLGDPEIAAIAVTHRHIDHAGGASALHMKTKAPIMSHPDEVATITPQLEGAKVGKTVADGETLDLGGLTLEFVHTPGHTMGSMCVFIKESGVLFTGDTILGFGTSVITPGEGDMALFLESLHKLLKYDLKTILPGHGSPITDPKAKIHELINHRLEREAQLLGFMNGGQRTVDDFLQEFYIKAGINSGLLDLARNQIRSHMIKLEREGKVKAVSGDSYRLQ